MLKPTLDTFLLIWAWSLYFTKFHILNFKLRVLCTFIISIVVSYCIVNIITIDTLILKNKKNTIAIDINNISENFINNDYITIISDLVKVFGKHNVYIIGYFSEKDKWKKIILLEKNNFFNKTGFTRKNIILSTYCDNHNKFTKTKEQCLNLGVNYYLGNQLNLCKNINNIIDNSYCINKDNVSDIKLKIINNVDNGKTKKNIISKKNSDIIHYYFNDLEKNGYYAIYIGNDLPNSMYAFVVVSKNKLSEVGFILKTGKVKFANKRN